MSDYLILIVTYEDSIDRSRQINSIRLSLIFHYLSIENKYRNWVKWKAHRNVIKQHRFIDSYQVSFNLHFGGAQTNERR